MKIKIKKTEKPEKKFQKIINQFFFAKIPKLKFNKVNKQKSCL